MTPLLLLGFKLEHGFSIVNVGLAGTGILMCVGCIFPNRLSLVYSLLSERDAIKNDLLANFVLHLWRALNALLWEINANVKTKDHPSIPE